MNKKTKLLIIILFSIFLCRTTSEEIKENEESFEYYTPHCGIAGDMKDGVAQIFIVPDYPKEVYIFYFHEKSALKLKDFTKKIYLELYDKIGFSKDVALHEVEFCSRDFYSKNMGFGYIEKGLKFELNDIQQLDGKTFYYFFCYN